ncbi:MAG: C40 family peptidase [Cocleimonas sp.]
MKKITTAILFIGLVQFLSGCSQGYRSNTYDIQQTHSSTVVTQNSVRNLMSRIAHSTIGAPYKWGGNNPQQGFDCSGLMSYVHRNAMGMKIPRTAAQQRDTSRTISYTQLQPGDMLFFKTGKRSNHVGIYIGDRKFVHAATGSKKVKVASMDSPYWHKRFVKFGTFL